MEDRRFYQHAGIDPIAIVRAAVHDLSTGTLDQGGSTITQQVAKNLFFTQEKQFVRKAAEVFMAFALEDSYSKDDILELYVNTIYFGDGYYGIHDAAQGYFGQPPAALTPYQSTLLAGIPTLPRCTRSPPGPTWPPSASSTYCGRWSATAISPRPRRTPSSLS